MALSKRAREARNKYQREWRRAHPDLHKAYIERGWERKAERMKEQEENSKHE